MGRTIITHVGTSLLDCKAAKPPRSSLSREKLDELRTQLHDGNEATADKRTGFKADLTTGLNFYWGATFKGRPDDNDLVVAQKRRAASPSEIASLSLLKPTAEDRVVLLHTDTEQGKFCGEQLCEALTLNLGNGFPHCDSECVKVEGLRVIEGETAEDADHFGDFVGVGLNNYVDRAWKEFNDRCNHEGAPGKLIFNVTGGYKGTIPFARDLVLILADHSREKKLGLTCSLCYLFERSDHLIWYGSFRIGNRWWQEIERHTDSLRAGLEDDGVARDELQDDLEYFYELPGRPERMKTNALGSLLLKMHAFLRP